MVTFTYIIAAVILLGLCIFIHELGHLIGGNMVGIKAKVFSLGYGKGILKKKIGDTTYQITLIPLGGYCKFYGEDPSEERVGEEHEFLSAPPMKRIIPVIMGPLFNLFFGIILFFIMNLVGYSNETNRVIIPEEYRKGEYISAAYKAGIRSGDRIIEINGKKITGFTDIQIRVIFSEGSVLNIKVKRDSNTLDFTVTPQILNHSGRHSIGVVPYGTRVMIAGLIQEDVAEKSGLKEMDEIKSVDGIDIHSPIEFTNYIKKRPGKKILFRVVRAGKEQEILIIPRVNKIITINERPILDSRLLLRGIEEKSLKINNELVNSVDKFISMIDKAGNKAISIRSNDKEYKGTARIESRGFIGVYPAISPEMINVQYGIVDGFVRAFVEPYEFIVMNLKGIGMLFSGKMSVRENLSGPIRIAKIAGDVAYYRGIAAFIILMAKISIILMVMNLLPIPVVDGGHIMFFLIEAVRGKPLSDSVMEKIQTAGVLILIMLGVFVIVNDISMLPFVQRLFN